MPKQKYIETEQRIKKLKDTLIEKLPYKCKQYKYEKRIDLYVESFRNSIIKENNPKKIIKRLKEFFPEDKNIFDYMKKFTI